MKKLFRITWYEGFMDLDKKAQKTILRVIEAEAESIDQVNIIQILPKEEKKRFEIEIEYCLRTAWHSGDLKDATETVSDYGSHSRFIYVEEVE